MNAQEAGTIHARETHGNGTQTGSTLNLYTKKHAGAPFGVVKQENVTVAKLRRVHNGSKAGKITAEMPYNSHAPHGYYVGKPVRHICAAAVRGYVAMAIDDNFGQCRQMDEPSVTQDKIVAIAYADAYTRYADS